MDRPGSPWSQPANGPMKSINQPTDPHPQTSRENPTKMNQSTDQLVASWMGNRHDCRSETIPAFIQPPRPRDNRTVLERSHPSTCTYAVYFLVMCASSLSPLLLVTVHAVILTRSWKPCKSYSPPAATTTKTTTRSRGFMLNYQMNDRILPDAPDPAVKEHVGILAMVTGASWATATK